MIGKGWDERIGNGYQTDRKRTNDRFFEGKNLSFVLFLSFILVIQKKSLKNRFYYLSMGLWKIALKGHFDRKKYGLQRG